MYVHMYGKGMKIVLNFSLKAKCSAIKKVFCNKKKIHMSVRIFLESYQNYK